MATSAVIVFQTLPFNHGQEQQLPGRVMEEIKKQDGFQRAFFGQKMEDPDTAVLCTQWSSRESALRYRSSAELASSVGTGATEKGIAIELGALPGGGVFDAPCTEVFTAFGAEEGFVENVRRFVEAVEGLPPVGYLGAAFGEGVGDEGSDGGEKVVRLVIGWESKERHLEAKEVGAIRDNIHELRTGRKAVDLFHVGFKEL